MTDSAPYLSNLLGVSKYVINPPYNKDEFNIRTSYDEEQNNFSKDVFEKNYQFKSMNQSRDKIAPLKESKQAKRDRLLEKEQRLDKWFGMRKKNNLTTEEKNDLIMLKLRNYLSPKQFYKSSEFKKLPKYFQVGTVIDSGDGQGAVDRIPRGQRKQNLVEQYLQEDRETQFSRKKFGEIQNKKQAIIKDRRLKQLKKFSKRIKKVKSRKSRG